MLDEWYSYGVFGHTEDQTLWALRMWEFFDDGVWPPEPPEYITDEYNKEKWDKVFKKKSTAVDVPTRKRKIKTSAAFTKAKDIAGEISLRLKRTGGDGEKLMSQVESEELVFDEEAQDALRYIIGLGRKRPYRQWLASRKYYKNHNKKI